ncbi:CAMK family protein kinase [Tritrichomonas foetus]|uniref:CAMK family protein kinase n=1 Tax=Tritrichomonas foetus TaxID=1144522 RepID=A0A1J4JMM6_9EUKA|nr:CAMK family protein kinase [Tritrichomonas foetus]|eukprot:OHS98797.1 CAMK family protein kinase [Tritrichomonas foetus]
MCAQIVGHSYLLEPETDKMVQKLPFNTHGYIFKEVIGHGSYSVVFKVYHPHSKQEFAAKVIHSKYEDSRSATNIIESEIDSLKHLCHPNIIKIYDFFRKYKHFFIILQLCEGGTMKSLVNPYSGMPLNLLISFMRQILQGFSYCHSKNISHRDIKPENIFIDKYCRPIISDFGFSAQTFETKVNSFAGSFIYKAPELIEKRPHCPFKSDIWSLGVTFYTMAFGVSPWPRISHEAAQEAILHCIYSFPPSAEEKLVHVLQNMIVIDPNLRKTADELLEMPLFTDGPTEIRLDEYLRNKMPSKKNALKSGSLPPLCLRIDKAMNSINLPANVLTAQNPRNIHNALMPMQMTNRRSSSSQNNATDPIKTVPRRVTCIYPRYKSISVM